MTGLQLIKSASLTLRNAIRKEFIAQGHSLTGGWERSQTEIIKFFQGGYGVEGFAAGYGDIVASGVSSSRIPYDPSVRSGRKTSKYIQGLQSYFMLRKGLSERAALSAAFATAHKHKREGMPTLGSYKYSKTGQRLMFIQRAEQRIRKELDLKMSLGMDTLFNDQFFKQKSEVI